MKTLFIIWTVLFVLYRVSELTISIVFTYFKPEYKTDSERANYWLYLMRMNTTRSDWIKYVLIGTPLAFIGAPIGFIGMVEGIIKIFTAKRIR